MVAACMSMLGCSGSREAERPPAEPPAHAASPVPETSPAPAAESTPTAAAPTPESTPTQPQSTEECAGICYRDLPSGGCETMPTCCPRTVHLKAPPHCPAGYTLDMNSSARRCAVNNKCVD